MNCFTHLIVLLALLLTGCDTPPQPPTSTPGAEEARLLDWDELMPADFQPGALFEGVDLSSLADGDPKARELMAQLRKLWDEAPVVIALDGMRIRLPGFAIPLETDGESVSQFLLVPYYGACIHVPPPPLNQTVLVNAPFGASIRQAFDPVWVTGQLVDQQADTQLAKAGYTLTTTQVSPYARNKKGFYHYEGVKMGEKPVDKSVYSLLGVTCDKVVEVSEILEHWLLLNKYQLFIWSP